MSVSKGLVFCIALFPLFTFAQPNLDEVVVTAVKSATPLSEITANLDFVNRDDLTLISHTHINETLQRVPGVWVSRGNGQEHLTAIRSPVLTGAGSCGAFLMSQDGVSLRAPGFCNVNELFESTSELAERVEVVKGPGSSVYGSNALHGVINVITPNPSEGLRSMSLEAGPDDYYRVKTSASTSNLRLDFSGTTDGGYKDESGFDQQKLLLKHQTQIGKKEITTTFSYTNLNQETAGFVLGHEVYKDHASKKANPNPEAFRDARSYKLVSQISQPLANGELTLKPYLRSVDMTFLQHFLPGQPIEENGHDSLGLQSLWTSDSGKWFWGVELDYTNGYLKETQPNPTDSGSAFLVETIPVGKHYDYDVDASLVGIFAQYDQALSERLTLSYGLRYQYMSYDYDNRMISGRSKDNGTACGFGGCRFSRPTDREDSFSDWSPKIGFIYDLNEQRQIYGSISRGYRAPQATELYRLQNSQSVSDIDPVELDAVEVGFRGSSDHLYYNISAFAMQKDNFIFRDSTRTNVDNGETTHAGLEVELDLSLSDTLTASMAFTYAEHGYDNNPALSATPIKGNRIDTAPKTLGSARLAWQATSTLNLELEWVHIGDYYEDPQNQHEYEGHDLIHLRGNWRIAEAIMVSGRLMNLTDKEYAERADFGFGNDRYFVGTPLSVFVGVSFDF